MTNLPTSRPLEINISTDSITESSYKTYYNLNKMTGLELKLIDADDTDISGGGGIRITKPLSDKVVMKFEQINLVFFDLALIKKQDIYVNQTDSSCNLYKYSFLLRTIKDDFSTRLSIEIPIHNYDDVSQNTLLSDAYSNSAVTTLAYNIISDISSNLTDISNGDLVSLSDSYNFTLNEFIPQNSSYFMYNYRLSSELSKYIFIDPENSPIVLNNETITEIENIFSQLTIPTITTTQYTTNEFITYNTTPFEYKVDPSKANANFDPDIYIDCQPTDNTNTNTIVSLTNGLLSGDTKEKVDKFLAFLLNIILIFIVVYFLYYKLPSFMKIGKSTQSVTNSGSTG